MDTTQNSSSPRQLALAYFQSWNKNDSELLRPLFAENAQLEDWNNNVQGIESVIEVNENIFNSLKKITASVKEIDVCYMNQFHPLPGKTFCRISIDIELNDGSGDTLEVMDVIQFDKQGKIVRLKAYNGTYDPQD